MDPHTYTHVAHDPLVSNGAVEDQAAVNEPVEREDYLKGHPNPLLSDGSDSPPETRHVSKGSFCVDRARWLFRTIIPYGGLASNCFTMASVTLGGGIILMPSSFAVSGILMAIIYLVTITVLTVYTMMLLGIAMEKTGYRTFEEMGEGLLGRWGGWFVGFIFWLSCVGTAIGYITTLMTLVTPILLSPSGVPPYLKTKSGIQLITSLFWLVFLLPMVIPKRVNSIRYVSAVGVFMVFFFVCTVVVHSALGGLTLGLREDMVMFTSGNQAVFGLSLFVFAYMCQGPAFSVYYEMKPRPSVRQLTIANAIALSTCMVFYILAGLFGYFDFASKTEDSVLLNYDPVNEPYLMAAYIGILVKVCAAYAMNMIPVRNFTYYCLRWDLDTLPYWKHTLAMIVTSLVVLIAGLFIPNVNLAFGLVGSLCGGFIGFIFPALFWMYCGNWSLKTVGIWHYLATYLLLVIGVIALVFGTIATVYSSFFV